MAKILFVNPVIRINDEARNIPYGLAQLAALAVREGHKVQVFDANAWRPTDYEIKRVLSADRWDVIATGGLVTTYGFVKKLSTLAKSATPQSFFMLGGGIISPIPKDIMLLLQGVDIGVIGEGYITFLEVLRKIDKQDRNWENIKGIIWRDESGNAHLNEERPLLEDMDSLPFPAWELFPVDIYFKNNALLLSEEAMTSKKRLDLLCSYGCKFRCKYCFHLGISGDLETKVGDDGEREVIITRKRKIRAHSPQYIVNLVKHARSMFGIDFISFLDENFTSFAIDSKWFDEFEKLWDKEGLRPLCVRNGERHNPEKCQGIHWGATAHVSTVNEDVLIRMKKLGCVHLDYGLESFSDRILKSIGKGSTSKMNQKAIIATINADIRPIPNQILGFPEEDFESLRQNLEMWEKLGIQCLPFFATPYPGSEWYYTYKNKIIEQYDGILENFLLDLGDATKISAVISKNFNAVELIGLRQLMVDRDFKRINEYERIRNSGK